MQDVPVGTHVYTLRGQDPEGSPVTYTISGDVFSADRSIENYKLCIKLKLCLCFKLDMGRSLN